MIYFLSDLHFGHENIIKFEPERRGHFKDVNQMNEALIQEWNELITNEDTVYNLGDFFFKIKPQEAEDILKRLNYKKMILIIGNHDHSNMLKLYEKYDITCLYADMIKYNKKQYYLSHYPVHLGGSRNIFNIHGHIHHRQMETNYHINVGYDALPKIALSFKELEQYGTQLSGQYKNHQEVKYD